MLGKFHYFIYSLSDTKSCEHTSNVGILFVLIAVFVIYLYAVQCRSVSIHAVFYYFCREWESPRIASSTTTLNSSRDIDTMEIPQGRCSCYKIIHHLSDNCCLYPT